MRIEVEPNGTGDLVTIMAFAIDLIEPSTIVEAQDTMVMLARKHGWTSFCEAYEAYETNYGTIKNPYELVMVFWQRQELERFVRYWE